MLNDELSSDVPTTNFTRPRSEAAIGAASRKGSSVQPFDHMQLVESTAGALLNATDYKGKYLNSLKIIQRLQVQLSEQTTMQRRLQEKIECLKKTRPQADEVAKLQDEKQKLQLDLERAKLQLEQKKTQLALLNEKKAENELTLKREKKTLLESFLKVRNKNHQLVQLHKNLEL